MIQTWQYIGIGCNINGLRTQTDIYENPLWLQHFHKACWVSQMILDILQMMDICICY